MSDIPPPHELTVFQPQSDGTVKRRIVYEPHESVKPVHVQLLRRLQAMNFDLPHVVSSRPTSSVVDNARRHRDGGGIDFYAIDIQNAFPSVDHDFLRRSLYDAVKQRRGKQEAADVETFVMRYGTTEGIDGLPLGYPCSPMLFDIISGKVDQKLIHYMHRRNLDVTYTRYLDDLTFSAGNGVFGDKTRRDLREVVETFPGYSIKHSKSRRHNLGRGVVVVTGVAIYPDGRLAPAPKLLAKTESVIRACEEKLQSGQMLFQDELDQLHGYNSVLHLAGDPERSATASVRLLSARYHRLLLSIK